MFNNIQQQNLADLLKAHLLSIPTPSQRRFALSILQGFERAEWYPQVFEAVFAEDGRLTFDGQRFEVQGDPAEVIPMLLTEYVTRIHEGMAQPVRGTIDTMEYVSIKLTTAGHPLSRWTVKKYIDEDKIQGQLVGRSLVFSQDTLDKFIADYIANPPVRGPKGPRKSKTATF